MKAVAIKKGQGQEKQPVTHVGFAAIRIGALGIREYPIDSEKRLPQ